MSQSGNESATVIVVAPREISQRIAREADVRVVSFQTLEELDRWRAQNAPRHAGMLIGDVHEALAQLGIDFAGLPKKLRTALEAIVSSENVASPRELEGHWASRRSFYRMWAEHIAEPPGTFLRHARAAYAERLLASGVAPKQAAAEAGFSSVDRMKKAIAARKRSR